MSNSLIFGLCILSIASFIIFIIYGIKQEKKAFNNGKCTECGCELIFFEENSMRGRGYKCAICNKVVWVSYECVDKKIHITFKF